MDISEAGFEQQIEGYLVNNYTYRRRNGTKSKPIHYDPVLALDWELQLVAHARANGPGQQYLIQHSAGSGKSNSIAWLAHRLASLHNDDDRRVFDSVVVITDRRVLDRQLRDTIKQFEQTEGVVSAIDKHSGQLAEALAAACTPSATGWPLTNT